MSKHAIIYDRASSPGQADNWSRADAQRVGAELAEKHGYTWELRQEVESGEELSNRPVMIGILEDIDTGTAHAIVCQDLTRLSRDEDGIDGRYIRQVCRENDALVITQDKLYDFSLDTDDDMADVQFLVAKWQKRANIRALVRGMKEKARQGGYMGGPPPLGYDIVYSQPVKEGAKLESDLAVCEPETPTVLKVFELFVKHGGRGAAQELNRQGYRKTVKCEGQSARHNGRTKRPFDHVEVLRIIRNPIYAGFMTWAYGQKESRHLRDFEPPMVHRPELQIVDLTTWELAQRVDRERSTNMPGRGAWAVHPFSALLRCCQCGGPLHGTRQRDARGKEVRHRNVYTCADRHRFGPDRCPRGQAVTENVAASAILPFVADLIEHRLGLEDALQEAANRYGKSGPEEGIETEIKAEMIKTAQAKERVVKAIVDGVVTNEEAAAQVAELRRKEQRLERELVKLKRKDEIRADFLAAMEVLRNQDIEATLRALLKGQPQVLGRLLRLIFKPQSIEVGGEGHGRNRRGVLKSCEFTDDFGALVSNGNCDIRFMVCSTQPKG